jgi:hypothetical protein
MSDDLGDDGTCHATLKPPPQTRNHSGDVDCESGEHPSKSLVRVPCNLESCKMCNRVKIAVREEARRQVTITHCA